jgi:hypothetical protein
MEGHKWQAMSSQFVSARAFKGRDCLGSYPSRVEATFQHLPHDTLGAQARVVHASQNLI